MNKVLFLISLLFLSAVSFAQTPESGLPKLSAVKADSAKVEKISQGVDCAAAKNENKKVKHFFKGSAINIEKQYSNLSDEYKKDLAGKLENITISDGKGCGFGAFLSFSRFPKDNNMYFGATTLFTPFNFIDVSECKNLQIKKVTLHELKEGSFKAQIVVEKETFEGEKYLVIFNFNNGNVEQELTIP
ncbi:hypothetical protein Dip518_000121 [Parelusimicrobium proximum]|uniref:hypothetical protein n=1 Tax=Parelusimicrobium proximum TaxID=3228953 RepID=UPI003D17ACB7